MKPGFHGCTRNPCVCVFPLVWLRPTRASDRTAPSAECVRLFCFSAAPARDPLRVQAPLPGAPVDEHRATAQASPEVSFGEGVALGLWVHAQRWGERSLAYTAAIDSTGQPVVIRRYHRRSTQYVLRSLVSAVEPYLKVLFL